MIVVLISLKMTVKQPTYILNQQYYYVIWYPNIFCIYVVVIRYHIHARVPVADSRGWGSAPFNPNKG